MWHDAVLVLAAFLVVLSVALFGVCAARRDMRRAQMQVLCVSHPRAPTAELE